MASDHIGDPIKVITEPRINAGHIGQAAADAPTDDAGQKPVVPTLADERTTAITLPMDKEKCKFLNGRTKFPYLIYN